MGILLGKKGIRQGRDPISPLLFVLVMEFFSRLMAMMGDLPDFKYHPMCKNLKLNHLCFADDLMILCKGHDNSIRRVTKALKYFNSISGLSVNSEKSQIFLVVMNEDRKTDLAAAIGFKLGTLPIKYLGVSLSSRKWNQADCQLVINKIANRIQCWSTKLLSYAGRVELH